MSGPITRRKFAQLLGGAAGASALLPFVPRASYAQGGLAPKRLLVIFHGMGYLEQSFWPQPGTDASDFTLGETQSVLEPFRDQLIYPDGLCSSGAGMSGIADDNAHGWGAATAFTASRKQVYATGPSFDQLIADHWNAESPRPFRHIGLGVHALADPHYACFYTGAQQPVTPQNDAAAAFDSLFASLPDDQSDSEEIARIRAQRGSVIDLVRGQLMHVQSKIGSEENDVLDAHLEHLRALELRVVEFESAECNVPGAPGAAQDDAAAIETQMDLVASALACDLTQVATLQLGHCDGGLSMLGLNAHDVTHASGDAAGTSGHAGVLDNHRDIDRWWADRWRYLLEKLDAVPDTDGSLLDNTLIVWGSDTTTGQTYEMAPHVHWRAPYVLAGGANWAFETGRHIQLAHPDGVQPHDLANWTPSSRLFSSILQRAGLDIDSFGDLDSGSGTLPGL